MYKFENDFKKYLEMRKKVNGSYGNFYKSYMRFIDNALVNNSIQIGKPVKYNSYMVKNKKDVINIMDLYNNDLLFYEYNGEIERMFNDILSRYNINYKINKKILSANDINEITDQIVRTMNPIVINVWFYILKIVMYNHGVYIIQAKEYLDKYFNIFKKYYECILIKNEVDEDIIKKLRDLINNPFFKVKDFKSKEEYYKELVEYTKRHNNIIKEQEKKVVKVEHKKPEEKNIEPKKVDKHLINIEYFETKVVDDTKEEIKNYVDAYLPALCNVSTIPNIEEVLPSSYLNNYEDIMLAILEAFEQYCEDKKTCTMIDTHIYLEIKSRIKSLN